MNQKPMLTAQDLAERFGVSIYTIYRLTTKPNGLTGYRVGRRIRFKAEEVDAYLEAQAIKPVEDAEVVQIRRFQYKPGMKGHFGAPGRCARPGGLYLRRVYSPAAGAGGCGGPVRGARKFTSACEFAQKREAAGAANTERPKEKS